MRWEFHPEALEEYRETTVYYAERDPALALRFIETVEDTIRRILESPECWRVLDEDVRRCFTHVSLMEFFTPSNLITSLLWL